MYFYGNTVEATETVPNRQPQNRLAPTMNTGCSNKYFLIIISNNNMIIDIL